MRRRIVSVAGLVIAAAVIASAGAATPAAADVSACDGQWSVVPSSDHSQQSGEIDSLNSVAALSSTDQWAVGSWLHYPDAYVFHTLVEHWDGSSAGWTLVPSPNPVALNSYFYGVAAAAPNDVWAVGGTDQSGPPFHSLDPGGSSNDNDLWGVAAVATGDVWAVGGVGSFLNPAFSFPLALHWDGSSWTQVSVPAPTVGQLLGVAAEPAGAGISATGDTVKPAQPYGYVGTLAEHLCPG